MYCSNCGKEIPNDSKYCPHCGANVSNLPFSDTPARDDTELHVEYLRMTPTKPKVIDKAIPNNIKTLKLLATIASIIGIISVLILIGTCVITSFVASSQSPRNFQIFGACWFIVVSLILIASATINLVIGILDKDAPKALGAIKARNNKIIRIVGMVLIVISVSFFCTHTYFLFANPAFVINEKNVWLRIVTFILSFADIIVIAITLTSNNHLVDTSKRIVVIRR